ncbi:MAG: hypothetical protein ACOCUR_01325 [Nanoarchaeota archaeon]
MSAQEVKKFYEEYQKKHQLPSFNIVDKELEISSLDGDKFILRSIRNKIKSRLENMCNMIEDVLNPDTSLSLLHECSYVNEKTKRRSFEMYKKMMYMVRSADLLDLEKDNAKEARYIRLYFKNMEKMNSEMKKIVSVRMNSWKKELSPYIKEEYFG